MEFTRVQIKTVSVLLYAACLALILVAFYLEMPRAYFLMRAVIAPVTLAVFIPFSYFRKGYKQARNSTVSYEGLWMFWLIFSFLIIPVTCTTFALFYTHAKDYRGADLPFTLLLAFLGSNLGELLRLKKNGPPEKD